MLQPRGASRTPCSRPAACRAVFAVLVAAPLLGLTGCSAANRLPTPVVVQPLVQAPGQNSVTVSDAQSGAEVALESGQDLLVRLPASPTTALEWSVVDLAPGVLAARGTTFERATPNVDADDAAGITVFRLHAAAAGTVALRFESRRPRGLAPAVRVVSFAVTVR